VYGSAPPAYLARARDRKVRFMGELGEAAKAEAFAHMDVLLVPSIWFEKSSLVTLEAFLFGVPVVASDIGPLCEIVSDGRSGLLVKVGDAGDLRAKIERLVKDRGELARLAANLPRVKSSTE
jgi:glycosyltransferase involved in cell wall biosynthesis